MLCCVCEIMNIIICSGFLKIFFVSVHVLIELKLTYSQISDAVMMKSKNSGLDICIFQGRAPHSDSLCSPMFMFMFNLVQKFIVR